MKRWFWDTKRRQYVDSHGIKLTNRALTTGIDEYIDSVQADIAAHVSELAAGKLSVSKLFDLLEAHVTALHGATGAIAYGGLNQMDDDKFDRIDKRIRQELDYLAKFQQEVAEAARMATPEQPLSAEGIANRAELYAEAGYSEWMTQQVEREMDNGVNKGRRICEDDAASCDECVDAATEDFIPLDEIPEIGTLQCLHNCRCEIEFSIEGQEFLTSEIFQGVVGGQDKYGGDVTIQ